MEDAAAIADGKKLYFQKDNKAYALDITACGSPLFACKNLMKAGKR